MIHLTTHRLVALLHYFSNAKDAPGISRMAYEVLKSRGLKPWSLEDQYSDWNNRGWFYKKLLWFSKPEFMKDENTLSPEALKQSTNG